MEGKLILIAWEAEMTGIAQQGFSKPSGEFLFHMSDKEHLFEALVTWLYGPFTPGLFLVCRFVLD